MRTRLKSFGQETGLIIDQALLDAAHLAPGEEVDIEIRGGALWIQRTGGGKHNPVEDAFKRVVDNPGEINRVRTAGSVPPQPQERERP
jgi:antitoxin component of MazEF toxin-antitoxin module